jgi:tetrahydromethanopterin S-methyltransferase subunit B
LKDGQFQPLVLNKTTGRIVDPSGRSTTIDLMPLQDASQLGVYVNQFLAKQTGTYEVQLPIGSLSERQVLTQSVAIRVPTREVQRPQRNDRLLADLAKKTGGQYSSSLSDSVDTLASIATREQINYLPGAPDRPFQQRLMGWFMALIATALSLEWLLRRLSKLA